ncbi:MAG: hypothetical protein IH945_04465 [Armatimonadetes bacterium]|nr:hypothetical protein [Armatimonadota bacterium]
MKQTTIIALAAALLLAGCGKGGVYVPKPLPPVPVVQIKAGEQRSIMPLQKGNQWVYTMESRGQSRDITIEVLSVESSGDATIALIAVNDGQGDVQVNTWRVDSTGVYQVTARQNLLYDPPQLLIPFPIEKGHEFKSEGTGPLPVGGEGSYVTVGKVLGPQQIDTAMGETAGRMSAIAVQSVTTWETDEGKNVSRATSWWVPGIGFVRQMQEFSTPAGSGAVLLKLKSYSFK